MMADRLAELLGRRPEVAFAFLFGSTARGTSGSLSDVDVAVWLQDLDAHQRFQWRRQWSARLEDALGRSVDLVVLNDASPLVRHRVLRDGIPLVDQQPELRVRLATRWLLDYLDTAPLRETIRQAVLQAARSRSG